MGKQKKKIGICVYCGLVAPLEKEDVIPKCLFLKPRPSDLVKIPSCRKCNLDKSKDDDFLRDLLVTDISVADNPIAQAIFRQKMLSSVRQKSSELARTAITKGRIEPFYTKAGIYLGNCVFAPVDASRINRIFTRIVRGLYYNARNERIPDEYSFEVLKIDPLGFRVAWPEIEKLGYNGPHYIGNEVFSCIWMYADADPFLTIWWLFFYDSLGIHVNTQIVK
jgi:hypothetical protein